MIQRNIFSDDGWTVLQDTGYEYILILNKSIYPTVSEYKTVVFCFLLKSNLGENSRKQTELTFEVNLTAAY